MIIEGTKSVFNMLSGNLAEDSPSVTVGYTADYAVYVHEDLTAKHKQGKQAKFLEAPARTLGPELGKIVTRTVNQGGTLEQGLLMAGLRLQRESQKIVPIDTNALRSSAFTALDKDVQAKSQEAYDKSRRVRERVLNKRRGKRK